MRSHDSVQLHAFQLHWPGLGLERVIDRDSRQSYLLLADADGAVFAVANVNPRQAGMQVEVESRNELPAQVRHYIDSRAGWLVFGAGP